MSNSTARKRKSGSSNNVSGQQKNQKHNNKRALKHETSQRPKLQAAKKKKEPLSDDEIIQSSESENENSAMNNEVQQPLSEDNESEAGEETMQQSKLRLAKMYIEEVREKVKLGLDGTEDMASSDESSDDLENDNDKIGKALRYESALKSGQLRKSLSKTLSQCEPNPTSVFHGHKHCVTCGCVSLDGLHLFTGGKDCSIIKWCLTNDVKIWLNKGKKKKHPEHVNYHKSQVNCLAISDDSKFLVSGGGDPEIFIWNPQNGHFISKLKGHKSSVLSLSFQPHSYQLFSSSVDRFVKIWRVDDECVLDNLCGHEGQITTVDASFDNPISCGSTDKSIRLWKVADSSQLVFNHNEYVDCVTYLSKETFATGDCSGCVSLWSTKKKRPVHKQPNAHKPKWVTSLSSIPFSDVLASGSSDGTVKLWRIENMEKLFFMWKLEVTGFVNFISFTPEVTKMILGVSKEHRLGRWSVFENCRNSTVVYDLLSLNAVTS